MIVSKVQKQPKPSKVVVVAPPVSPGKSAKSAKSAAVAVSAPQVQAPQQEIRQRAFEIYEQRGGAHGYDLQDWFHAELQFPPH